MFSLTYGQSTLGIATLYLGVSFFTIIVAIALRARGDLRNIFIAANFSLFFVSATASLLSKIYPGQPFHYIDHFGLMLSTAALLLAAYRQARIAEDE